MTLRTARPTFAQNLSTDGVRRLVASYHKSANGAIVDDFKLKQGFLYTQVRAISARVNQNYDGWPSEELKKSYRTFLGKPVFVNHQNFDPSKARGRVVAARYVESGNDKFVEVIQEIDANRFPKLAHEIRTGGLDSVSMGVEAGFTKCSVCDNKATDLHDMCSHVKYHKGEYLPHAKTGKKTLVFENCLVAGTLVTMGDGTTRLIEDIQPGDLILDHLGTPRTVLQAMNRPVNEDTFRIHRQNNQTQVPQMTGNHPVLAIRGATFGKDTLTRQGRLDRGLRPEFIEAQELQVGDWVCETRPSTDSSLVKIVTADYTRQERQHETCFVPTHTLPDTLELTEEFGRFIGLFLAEGSVNKALTQTDFAFHQDETDLADFVDRVARNVLGLTSITHQERNGGRTVTVFSSPLSQLLSNFGIGAANKSLPNEFMSAPIEFLRGVVAGHEDGDGLHVAKFVERHGHKHFTCSPKLAEQIYTIHVMLGNTPYHSTKQVRPDYEYPGKNPASWLPMHTVGFGNAGQKKVGRLSFGPWNFVRINKIEAVPYTGLVYNLEVADTHTYVAEGVAVHNCYKLGFFELSYVFDPADETAVVSKVLVANKRHAYGEIKAPEAIDTLRNTDDADDDHFHHYVESPKELRTPDMARTIFKDKQQEEDGLDNERRAEDVADLGTADGGKKIVEPDVAHEEAIDDFLDWCDSINVTPSQDALDDFSNAYHLNNEDYQAISEFLDSQDGGAGLTPNANQPVPRMSRRKMSTYRYAEEEFQPGGDGDFDEDDFEPGAPPHDHDGDGDIDYEGEEEDEGSPEDLVEDFVSWCEQNGAQPDEQALDAFAEEAQLGEEEYQLLSELVGGAGGEEGMEEDPSMMGDPSMMDPSMMDPSMMGGDPSMMDPSQMQMQARRASTGKNNTSSQKKRRAQKGSSMARETLASRGRKAASRQRLHRLAGDDGHFDGGPYDENNQGEQEEIFLSQTPGEESLSAPVPGDGTISNTENTLVARITQKKNSLARDILAWNEIQQRKHAADGGIPDADTVNPALSGTDDQSLKGQDFERVQPDKVETQSKDASLKAFAAFDNWLRNTTGRTASQHGNANFIRRQAARWAGTYGYPVEVLFPALGTFLRQARRIEGSTNMRRTADEKLEVAAPQDRIDVEAPVSNTTDADAQASQFDLGDFGGNASDNVADPDLSTDSQIWAPGEGVKESNRKADGVAAIRLAEAYIKAGLKPESEKYNLVAQFQTMRHATVTDRTRLLEAVLKTASFSRRVTAGSNRGAAPRTSIPRGLMNGGGMSRSASMNRVAANDPSTDSDLFL